MEGFRNLSRCLSSCMAPQFGPNQNQFTDAYAILRRLAETSHVIELCAWLSSPHAKASSAKCLSNSSGSHSSDCAHTAFLSTTTKTMPALATSTNLSDSASKVRCARPLSATEADPPTPHVDS